MRFSRVLDLTDGDTLQALGIAAEAISGDDTTLPRAIGEAANHLGFEAILAPSAAGDGVVVAIILNNQAAGSLLSVEGEDHAHRPL